MSSLQNGFDEHKPSLFGKSPAPRYTCNLSTNKASELLSEQQLAALIPPSLRYLLTVATYRRPRYLLRVLNSFDELYALLMLAVERHYLLTYGGSFTENFYGLKRERILRIKGGEAPRASIGVPALMRETLKLRPRDVWKNLTVLVGVPYLKRKLDESYDIHAPATTVLGPGYNRNALPPNPNIRQRIIYYYKWFLQNVYPSINAAYYFSLLAFNLAYLFDNTKFSSPLLWLIGTRIRRLGAADHHAIALATQPPIPTSTRPRPTTSLFNPQTLTATLYPTLLSGLKLLLPTSIFALKFLEWWHASDFARHLSRKASEHLSLPPPNTSTNNTKNKPNKNTVSLSSSSHLPILTVPPPSPATSSLCPICLQPIRTPTAAPSGYVFCYTCIFKWIQGTHERQIAFMHGDVAHQGWGDDELDLEPDSGNESGSERGAGGGSANASSGKFVQQGTWASGETAVPAGTGTGTGNGTDTGDADVNDEYSPFRPVRPGRTREGKWDCGEGRCAVTARRVLGGTDGLRRVMV